MTKKITFLILLIVVLFSSCTQVPVNSADNVRMNLWKNTLKNGTTVTLSFDVNNCAVLKTTSKDKQACTTIEGLCIIDKKSILISDEATKENFVFSYKATGSKLKLKNDYGSVILKKVENFIE
jgi:hypothetical protein